MKIKKIQRPMSYRFEIGNGKYWEMQLPCPIEELNKKERTRLFKEIRRIVDSIALKSKMEAKARHDSLLQEAEKLKEDYEL